MSQRTTGRDTEGSSFERRCRWLRDGKTQQTHYLSAICVQVTLLVTVRSSEANCRYSRSPDFLRREGGMSDRHGCVLGTGQSFNLGTQLFRERLDDARTETGFALSKDAIRLAHAIVGN